MLNLKTLAPDVLVTRTKKLAKTERKITVLILEHLREIQNRRLYLDYGYSSLFKMCVKEFGYCNASAQRRIDAMSFFAFCQR